MVFHLLKIIGKVFYLTISQKKDIRYYSNKIYIYILYFHTREFRRAIVKTRYLAKIRQELSNLGIK